MDMKNKYKEILRLDDDIDVRNIYFGKISPAEIWKEVAEKDKLAVSELCKAMKKLVYRKGPNWIINGLSQLLYETVYKKHGLFIDESDFWADQCENVSKHLMAFLQRQYTLGHAACSTTCIWDECQNEMVCVRSLDWAGADDIANCSRIFKFFDDKSLNPVFQAAGVAGMVGILTGMKEGFSLCINYAPWRFGTNFKPDPLFAIRNLLQDETIKTFAEAKQNIEKWEVAAPCFITICGQEKGEACVVEIGEHNNYTRELNENYFIVQTNHFDIANSPFKHHNKKFYNEEPSEKDGGWYCSKLLKNSAERKKCIEAHLKSIQINTSSLDDKIIKTYLVPPVLNYETAQLVIMRPKSNSIKVFKCTSKYACTEKEVEVVNDTYL